jgi:hypothetical protein
MSPGSAQTWANDGVVRPIVASAAQVIHADAQADAEIRAIGFMAQAAVDVPSCHKSSRQRGTKPLSRDDRVADDDQGFRQ